MYRNEQKYTFQAINRDFKILHLLMIKNKFNYVKNNKSWNNAIILIFIELTLMITQKTY